MAGTTSKIKTTAEIIALGIQTKQTTLQLGKIDRIAEISITHVAFKIPCHIPCNKTLTLTLTHPSPTYT